MKKIKSDDFRVMNDFEILKSQTSYDLDEDEDHLEDELKETSKKLGEWQDKLYAHGKYSVLICIQGMDTAGKDSLIREVFKYFNSRGVVVHSFKTPSPQELKKDYLWRHYLALPDRGKFGIFNRTHYENVLVTRVHPAYILKENIPGINKVADITPHFWDSRFEDIKNFEEHLTKNGTIIFKFFLNISKDEQRHRLLRRLNKPDKTWKFSPGDLEERKLWDEYQKCYEDAINNTSTSFAPWYNIPSNDKDTARLIFASILLEELKKYKDIDYPEPSAEILENIEAYKDQLTKE